MAKGPYSEKVMDHFMNPRNMGEIEDANGIGEVGNPACGDVMKIFLKINDDMIVEDVKFKTFGCGAAIASSSMATELMIGKSVEELLQLTNDAIVEALGGLPPAKIHCSVMAEEAIEEALKDYYKSKGEDPSVVDDMKAKVKKDN
ncbi:FeS cluster assembly scaffold protein NifU [Denitrovibrio acetiphilus DSM 12809]|uniref:FeS cluster assembly scaffold protein NifU n=1 Tax=Denitrovibrio acetiphilus (strain DSM 12809 / NBRC 114555 / N2460) TaxID=522772 RepID=D4H7L7_DENA2|nr:Fe-S cluster assembly scaffold protein NifU [Denitrovibrio acetiphilus]ADD68016.1 FeS cluster assembly scaffold protein NifU [Denitrovibrio acetiphilus DSM 12809]